MEYQRRQVRGNVVTTALVSSRAGDAELTTFVGEPSEAEMQQKVYEKSPDWWENPDNVQIDDFQIIEFVGNADPSKESSVTNIYNEGPASDEAYKDELRLDVFKLLLTQRGAEVSEEFRKSAEDWAAEFFGWNTSIPTSKIVMDFTPVAEAAQKLLADIKGAPDGVQVATIFENWVKDLDSRP